MLRHGDLSQVRRDKRQYVPHSNFWATQGYLKFAWDQVRMRGAAMRGPVGVTGSNRGLEALGTLATVWKSMQNANVIALRSQWLLGDAVFIRWHHDATPMLLQFGSLQGVLESVARYLIQVEDARGFLVWKSLPYEEFKRLHPRASTNSGVLEVFGQLIDIFWSGSDLYGAEGHQKVTVEPMLLKACNANCISDAAGRACHWLSFPGIEDLCGQVKWVFLGQFPDGVSSNLRQQAYWQKMLEPIPNCLFTKGACWEHKLHRIAVKGTKESELIGHCHALHTVQSDTSRRIAIQSAATTFFQEHVCLADGAPDAHCMKMQKALISHTLLRELDHTGGIV